MFKINTVWPILTATFCFLGLASPLFADQNYRVQKGDNLYRIGVKFGVPYKKIMEANGLNKTVIHPDQLLIIPSRNASPMVAQSRPKVSNAAPPAPRPTRTAEATAIQRPSSPYNSVPNNSPIASGPLRSSPFAQAQPHETPAMPPAVAIRDDEDPLNLGYRSKRPIPATPVAKPAPTPKASAIAKKLPSSRSIYPSNSNYTPRSTYQQPQIAKTPSRSTYSRGLEVPASAHYHGSGKSSYSHPSHCNVPMPSFKNACTPQPRSRHYTVQSGDSVWGISRRHGCNPIRLRKTNNILFSRIRPGMKLVIPE